MLFSKRCSYAILALAYMAREPARMFQVKEIADEAGMPYHFLGQIMRELTRAGLLTSAKGKSGGFHLLRPPGSYSLLEIRGAIDGNDDFERCLFCTRGCPTGRDCPFQYFSEPIRDLLLRHLSSINLCDMTQIMQTVDFSHGQAERI